MPSVQSLQSNEACRLGASNHQHIRELFTLQHSDDLGGLSTVVFTRQDTSRPPQRYQLSVVCQPIEPHTTAAAAQPFTVYLHVHLL